MKIFNSQNANTSPAFKMKIRIASEDYGHGLQSVIFRQLKRNELSKWPHFVSQMASSTKKVATQRACDCNVLIITNGRKSNMFHLIPSYSNLENVNDFNAHAKLKDNVVKGIQKAINNLKRHGREVEACVTGGLIFEQDGRRSVSMLNGLLNLLKSNQIKPTVLWGQYGGSVDAVHFVKNNELILYPNGYAKNYLDKAEKAKNVFGIFNLKPQDELWVNNLKQNPADFQHEGKSILDIKQTQVFNYEG